MKSEADPRRRPIFCVILENIVNLGRKVKNRRLVRSDDLFFFRDHCILTAKSALPGMISSDDLSCFLEFIGFLGRKLHYLQWRTQKVSKGGQSFVTIMTQLGECQRHDHYRVVRGHAPKKFCKITPKNTHFRTGQSGSFSKKRSHSGGYSNTGARGKNYGKLMFSRKKKGFDFVFHFFLPTS